MFVALLCENLCKVVYSFPDREMRLALAKYVCILGGYMKTMWDISYCIGFIRKGEC